MAVGRTSTKITRCHLTSRIRRYPEIRRPATTWAVVFATKTTSFVRPTTAFRVPYISPALLPPRAPHPALPLPAAALSANISHVSVSSPAEAAHPMASAPELSFVSCFAPLLISISHTSPCAPCAANISAVIPCKTKHLDQVFCL
jgi:hypothetical protein